MKLENLILKIEKTYPRHLAESWDNVGLMIGDGTQEIHKVLTVLEINADVVEEAMEKKVDLIVTHHPFFFSKFNQITSDTVKGSLALRLIQNQIAVYSMHTNYDIAFDGMNDSFVKRIGYHAEDVFLPVAAESWYLEAHHGKAPGLGRLFTLEQDMTLSQFSAHIKEILNMDQIRFIGNADAKIHKVAVITGAAAEMFQDAQAAGADVLISGDMKYHIAHDALDCGMNVIDCGHFETENIFRDSMCAFLRSITDLEVIASTTNLNPFQWI